MPSSLFAFSALRVSFTLLLTPLSLPPHRKILPRRRDIAPNLLPQLLSPGKPPFIAKTRVKSNLHRPSRNLFVETEQMALHGNALPIERGPRTHIRHRPKDVSLNDNLRRIHPQLRQQFLLGN